MEARIYPHITGKVLVKHTPPRLRSLVSQRRFENEEDFFTLLLFPTQRNKTILSGAVRRVLDKISSEERLVAFGNCFTQEAIALLNARNVEIFVADNFDWTDASYMRVRESISSGVKFPTK